MRFISSPAAPQTEVGSLEANRLLSVKESSVWSFEMSSDPPEVQQPQVEPVITGPDDGEPAQMVLLLGV